MTKKTITPAATLLGAALGGSLGAFGLAQAAGNPFSARSLEAGYMRLAEAGSEGKCGAHGLPPEPRCWRSA
ncbi:hypothetical protein [Thiocapsa sp.]|uniref:hypothetical protein n=1 Tax=Thiocapsa sp. TaxID=2024551 RepID=UPI0025E38DCC|nr:hypothetical protein [Thiocapsa sp.]